MQARRLVAALVAVALLAACQPGPASPSQTTSATPTTQSPSTPATPSQEELFKQATEVYRQIRIEVDKLEAAGGAKELPPSLKQHVTGELEKNLHAVYVVSWPQQQKIRTGPAPVIAWTRPQEAGRPAGAVTATNSCLDATKSSYKVGSSSGEPGVTQHEILYFGVFQGQLKAFDSAWTEATRC